MSYASSCLYPSNINAKILQSENILNSDTITTSKLVVTEPLEIDDLTLKTLVVEQSAVIGTIEEDDSVYSAPLIIGADLYNSSSLFCYGNIETQSKLTSGVLDTSQLNIGAYDEATTSFVSNASLDSGGNLTNTSIVSTGSIIGNTLQGNSGISATLLSIGSIDTDTSVITSNMSIDSTGTLRNTNIVSSGTITGSNVNAPLLNIGVTGDTPNLTIDSTGYLRTEGMLKSTAAIGFQSGYSNGDGTFATKVSIGYDATSDVGEITFSDNSVQTTAFKSGVYAPLASPTFTGTPLAPTQASGNSSTALATTAFVSNAIINKIMSQDVGIVDMALAGVITNTANGETSTCQYLSINIPIGFSTTMFSLFFKFEGTTDHQTSSLAVSIENTAGKVVYGQTILSVEKTYSTILDIYANVVFPYYSTTSDTFTVVVTAESEDWTNNNSILIYGGASEYTTSTSMPVYQVISNSVEIS